MVEHLRLCCNPGLLFQSDGSRKNATFHGPSFADVGSLPDSPTAAQCSVSVMQDALATIARGPLERTASIHQRAPALPPQNYLHQGTSLPLRPHLLANHQACKWFRARSTCCASARACTHPWSVLSLPFDVSGHSNFFDTVLLATAEVGVGHCAGGWSCDCYSSGDLLSHIAFAIRADTAVLRVRDRNGLGGTGIALRSVRLLL